MHPVDLIAACLPAPALDATPVTGICCVTGTEGQCLPRKALLGKSFTNGDCLAAPGSPLVGLAAYTALTYKWERMSSWYCDGKEFVRLDRQGVRAMVLGRNYGPVWSGYATTSYKKHGALVSKINSAAQVVWRFEMLDVDCTDHERLLTIWARLNEELRAGIGRSLIESLDCPPFLLRKIGVSRWVEFERWARPLYQGGLYRFLCYLLPSKEELKSENMCMPS